MNIRFFLSYDIKITLKSHFCRKSVIILSLCTQRCFGCQRFLKVCKPLVVYQFYCMALHHFETQCHLITYSMCKYFLSFVLERKSLSLFYCMYIVQICILAKISLKEVSCKLFYRSVFSLQLSHYYYHSEPMGECFQDCS